MSYLMAVHTDLGITKKTNQDSLCVKEARTIVGNVTMALICDGMGGLAKGEVASASVILAFSQWFDEELPKQIVLENYEEDIQLRWNEIITFQNEKIGKYGESEGIQLGTTITVLLIINEEKYIVGHVGDSRLYQLKGKELLQLTEDQTWVSAEIKAGRLTEEEAKVDNRRNVLLQCVGASKQVVPQYINGSVERGTGFLLCSDGFRHEISSEEIFAELNPVITDDEVKMKNALVKLTELNKERNETDNISSIILKVV